MEHPAKVRTREEGGQIVEFALVLPVLALALFGIVGFGQALYAYHFVSYAAREATRYAIVRGNSWGGSCASPPPSTPGCQADSSDISAFVASIAPEGIPVTSASSCSSNSSARGCLDVTSTVAAGPNNFPTSATCGATMPASPGCAVQVMVVYEFGWDVPFLHLPVIPMTSESDDIISQ